MANEKDEKARSDKLFSQDELADAMKTMARAMAEEMIPVVMAGSAAAMKGFQQTGKQPYNPGPICPTCKQLQKACGGVPKIEGTATQLKKDAANNVNHVKMVVYPQRYPEFAEWFRGRGLNGVWYLSNGPGHQVWVPRSAAGDIQHAIETFETNERETRMGRTRQHNSGNLNSPNKVGDLGTEGWR